MRNIFISLTVLLSAVHCAQNLKKDSSLESIVAGPQRSKENKQRDQFRNPVETLQFFDVEPEMTVVEISPGTGWYTEILGPYLEGKLYLAAFSDDSEREYFRNANKVLREKIEKDKVLYGDIKFTVLEVPSQIGPIAPSNSVDRVLTFRNVHNWMKAGKAKEVFEEFFRVLKKGGVLGVVEHRANPKSKKDPKAENGYVHPEQVLEIAKGAGFKLVGQSEVNSNSKDTADHPQGVWTLPPRYRLGDKDKTKYMEIGESDRMTLKFIKP